MVQVTAQSSKSSLVAALACKSINLVRSGWTPHFSISCTLRFGNRFRCWRKIAITLISIICALVPDLFLNELPNRLLTLLTDVVESDSDSPLDIPNHSTRRINKCMRSRQPKCQLDNILPVEVRHFDLDSTLAEVPAYSALRPRIHDANHVRLDRNTHVFSSIPQ